MNQIHSYRQLAFNLSFLTAGEILAKALSFFSFILLARVLGAEKFGYLEFTLSIMVFLTLLVDFGSGPYGAREAAKNRQSVPQLVSGIVSLRTFSAVTLFLIATVSVALFNTPPEVRSLLPIYALSLLAIPFFLQWVLQGLDLMKWVALGSVFRQIVFAAGVLLLLRQSTNVSLVGWIELLAVSVYAFFTVYVTKTKFPQSRVKINLASIKSCVRESWAIGLSDLTWAITWYFTPLLLGILAGAQTLGWFAVAHRPVMTLQILSWLYFYNLFPSFSRSSLQPHEKIQDFAAVSIRITAWIAAFTGASGVILARPLLHFFFGAKYENAVPIFQILIWIVPLTILSGHYKYLLIAFSHQKVELVSSLITALISILCTMLLVPLWESKGGAVALLSAATSSLALCYIFVRQKIGLIPMSRHLWRPLLATVLMITIFLFLQPRGQILATVTSLLCFPLLLIILQSEVRRLLR